MHRGLVAGALVATLGTAAAGVGGVVALRADQALPGTTVAGVAVGGLDRTEIATALADVERRREDGQVVLRAGDREHSVPRAELGVDLDLARTADRAVSAGRAGLLGAVVGPLLGERERSVEPVVEVDAALLRERVDRLATELGRAPEPGGFRVEGTTVSAVPPAAGRSLDRDGARRALADALRSGGDVPVELPVDEVAPPTTAAQVDAVVAAATQALAAPYVLQGAGESVTLAPEALAPLLSSAFDDGALRVAVEPEGLRALVAEQAGRIDRPASSATFAVSSGASLDAKDDVTWSPRPASVAVQPGAAGRQVDVDAATARLAALVGGAQRVGELPLRETLPALTTEQAQAAGVRAAIGTFTTYFTAGQPRATNIRRIAELVDGAYLPPGQSLSLNGTAGPRTRARGFVADGAIVDGELTDEVGGGVSQFATTLFNAAFFAGLPIEQHKPHSFYISRYPAGRESTVYFGSLDVVFRNDTGHGLVVDTSSTPSSVSVTLYGDNGGRTVRATHGPREPRPDGGFRIAVTRTVTGGDGVGGTRTFRTSYDPEPEE